MPSTASGHRRGAGVDPRTAVSLTGSGSTRTAPDVSTHTDPAGLLGAAKTGRSPG